MNVELPDGTTLQDVPDGTTKDQLRAKLSANGYDVSKLEPPPSAQPGKSLFDLAPVDHSAIYRDAGEIAKNIAGGLASKVGEQAQKYGMALPNAIRDISLRQRPGTTSEELAPVAAKAGVTMGADPESLAYKGARAAPEVLESLAPVNAMSGAVRSVLPRAVGRFAPIVSDVAANAAYAGAQSGAEGKGITEIMKDAAMAGGGAALGGIAGGAAQSGVAPALGQRARTLIANDITPTYGQMLGRGGSAVENAAGYAPIVGPAIDRARGITLKQYSRAEVNRALEPLGEKTGKIGEDAVAHANELIDASYNNAVPQTFLPAKAAQDVIRDHKVAMESVPLLSEQQIAQINKYVDTKIQPELSLSQQTNMKVPGRTAKNLDAELGTYARKYSDSANPADHPMGDAFRELQMKLREALDSNNPEALKQLQASNAAFRNMIPVSKAATKTPGQIGEFSPVQMFNATEQAGQAHTDLNRAARELLPTSHNPIRSVTQMGGGLGAGVGDPLLTGLGMGLAHTAYSLPVRNVVAKGIPVLRSELLRRKLPFTLSQLGARIGAENSGD